MASVYRKGKRWYANFRDATGARKNVATSAETKTAAKQLAQELEAKAERQRRGLESIPVDCTLSFAELCEWWLKERCPPPSVDKEESRLAKHIFVEPLGKLLVPHVTAARIEERFRAMTDAGASPASINKLRGTLHSVFAQAHKADLWRGANPIAEVEARKVPKRAYSTLRADEVPNLLKAVPEGWRGLFACALFTGLRKGELYGLQKADVDLTERTMLVTRSHGRDTTKGGHEDTIPIADSLLPYLKDAVENAPGSLVFPREDGSMRPEHSSPEKVLRRALKRAGFVDAFDHLCRRAACRASGEPHVERHADDAERHCPKCNMVLWPRAVVRPMRFQDLRHTTCTLLLRAGVAPQFVQRILRHGDLRTTMKVYAHLDVNDLRGAVENLPTVGAPERPTIQPMGSPDVAATGTSGQGEAAPRSTRLLPAQASAKEEAGPSAQIAPNPASEPLKLERNTRFELATFALARRRSTN